MMTQAQEDVIKKVEELMREHFDAGIFVVEGESESSDRKVNIECGWHGGFTRVMGMLHLAIAEMNKKQD